MTVLLTLFRTVWINNKTEKFMFSISSETRMNVWWYWALIYLVMLSDRWQHHFISSLYNMTNDILHSWTCPGKSFGITGVTYRTYGYMLLVLILNLFNMSPFNVHGSVHRKNILIYIQQDATLHSLFYLKTALHVSGGTITHHQERK